MSDNHYCHMHSGRKFIPIRISIEDSERHGLNLVDYYFEEPDRRWYWFHEIAGLPKEDAELLSSVSIQEGVSLEDALDMVIAQVPVPEIILRMKGL